MEIAQIEERIEKKKAQIAKIEKRIAKWESAKSEAGFKKEFKYMEMDGKYYNQLTQKYDLSLEDFKARRYEQYCESCDREILWANNDLRDANIQLEKYNNQLKLEQVKQDKLSEERIQVLMDFLANWKQKVTDYIHENVKLIPEYYEANRIACDMHNTGWRYFSREEVEMKYKLLSKEAKAIKVKIDDLSFEVYDLSSENLTNDKQLSGILDKEVERKYLKLIDSITEKVGEITDTSSLSIGPKGDIEGYITGTKGKVHVETIGAGGYNDSVILASGRHGQCYHYRTLIRPVH